MPAAVAVPAIASVAGSIGSSLIGSNAAGKAAKQQAAMGQRVGQQLQQSTADAVSAGYAGIEQGNTAIDAGLSGATGEIRNGLTNANGLLERTNAALSPYQTAGSTAAGKLGDMMQQGFSFNPADLQNDPGYQFQLAQGMKAIQNAASVHGAGGGSAAKSLMQYNQGLAGTAYQGAYDRARNTYSTNVGTLMQGAGLGMNANQLGYQANAAQANNWMNSGNALSGMMYGAGNNKANLAMQGNQWIGQMGLQGQEAAGNAFLGQANAQAAGTMGQANAWQQGLGGMANGAQFFGLQKMMTPKTDNGAFGNGTYLPPGMSFNMMPDASGSYADDSIPR